MAHIDTIRGHLKHVSGHHGHHAKKEALFAMVHDLIVQSVHECIALGATPAEMKPFTDRIDVFERHKAEVVAVDLL